MIHGNSANAPAKHQTCRLPRPGFRYEARGGAPPCLPDRLLINRVVRSRQGAAHRRRRRVEPCGPSVASDFRSWSNTDQIASGGCARLEGCAFVEALLGPVPDRAGTDV